MNFAFGIVAIAAIAISAPEDSAQRQSVLETVHSEPILTEPAPVNWNTQETVLEKPAIVESAPFVEAPLQQAPFYAENRLIVSQPLIAHPTTACSTCHCVTCCCKKKTKVRKPRKRNAKFCLVDPKGCTHEACVKVSECCDGEAPTVNWHKRALGRQVATLCWDCCDEEAKVIVTRRGKVKVRD